MSSKEEKFKESCPESAKILSKSAFKKVYNESLPSEVKEIMIALGRNEYEGEVKGSHLGKILTFLQQEQQGNFQAMISQLALVCGMKARYVKEDYINGLICFGVIAAYTESNCSLWKWIGMKAFERKNDGEK